ncbi:MAG TPA: outer membrane lipoprotein carrier protein LolA [Hyphomicrobiaceae bacterium]|nr:outer membrane lipoprotein carrier protein LolA [Hyphomicrobiaceae bacterium]
MRARWTARVMALAALVTGLGTAALAQTAAKAPVPAPAAPEWNQATVTREPGSEFDPKQLDLIQKLTTYFNQMGDMKGEFHQTSPDGKRLRGRIYVKRPSFFRFEYRRPSRQVIISDSKSMIIQDLDLKTEDRWGLDRTPFRIVLRKDVDLLRDSKILEVAENDDRVHIVLQDKSPDTAGRLKLLFASKPELELKEWTTTDSQGLDTRVELFEFSKADDLDPKLFEPTPVFLEKLQK